MKYRDIPFIYSDTWITNGCIAVKKEVIKDVHKYCKPAKTAQPDIERVIPQNPDITWIKSDRIFDDGSFYIRVFENKSLGKEVYFNDEYVSHFSIEELSGEVNNPCISSCGNIVLMPCRLKGEVSRSL